MVERFGRNEKPDGNDNLKSPSCIQRVRKETSNVTGEVCNVGIIVQRLLHTEIDWKYK